MPKHKKKTHFLRRKNLIDVWSIPHFLFGVVAALFTLVFDWPVELMFVVTFIVAILWEFLEMHFRLREALWNVVTDVILPLIAFPVTLLLVDRSMTTPDEREALLVIVLIIYAFTNFFAWQARIDGDRDFLS